MSEVSLSQLEVQVAALRKGGEQLRGLDRLRIAMAVGQAVRDLADPNQFFALSLRRGLHMETGLSLPMIEWGLSQLAASFEQHALESLCAYCEPRGEVRLVAPRLSAVILANTVFTASLGALALPLLAKSPVVVKVPRTGAALVAAFAEHLNTLDVDVGRHLLVAAFGRDEETKSAALWRHADVVSAYGDDATMATLRSCVPPSARLIEHGHGLSAAFISAQSISSSTKLNDVARRLALDVAAYDQTGCLSPQFAFVESQEAASAVQFAQALSAALGEVEAQLPRGRVPVEVAAQLMQWRGVAGACGELHASKHHACAVESGDLRFGPGYRHISIYPCSSSQQALERLSPLGAHLKSLGIAGMASDRAALAAQIPAGLTPRLCQLGTMQSPPLDAYFDGQAPFFGLLNYIQH